MAIDIAYLKEEALQKKKLYAQEHFPFSIEAQLNTLDKSYIASLDQRRREEFQFQDSSVLNGEISDMKGNLPFIFLYVIA